MKIENELNILYISSVCSEEMYRKLEKNIKIPMHYSIQKFHNSIINGLVKCNKIKIDALCGIPVNRKNIRKTIFKRIITISNNVKYDHIGFVNYPVIKQISICIGMINRLISWNKKNKDNLNKVIIFDASYITITPILVFLSKILKIKKVAIVADIYGYMSNKLKERKGRSYTKYSS